MKEYLTTQEVAVILGYSYGHFMNYISTELPRFKRGRKIMYKREDVQNYINKNTIPA